MKKFTLWSKKYLLSLSFLLAFGLMSCQDNELEPSNSELEVVNSSTEFTAADQQELSQFTTITINGETTTDLQLVHLHLQDAYSSHFDYKKGASELAIFLTKKDYEAAIESDPQWKRIDEESLGLFGEEDNGKGGVEAPARMIEKEFPDFSGQRIAAHHDDHNYDDLSDHAIISRAYTNGTSGTYRYGHFRSTRNISNLFDYHYSGSNIGSNVNDVQQSHNFILANLNLSTVSTNVRNTRNDRRYYRFRFWSGGNYTGSYKTIRVYPNQHIKLTPNNTYHSGAKPQSVQRNSYTY